MSGLIERQIADTTARQANSHMTCRTGHSPVNDVGVCLTCHRAAFCYPCGTPLRVEKPNVDGRGFNPQVCSKCARFN